MYLIIGIPVVCGYMFLLNQVDSSKLPLFVQFLAFAIIPFGIYLLIMVIGRTRLEKLTYEALREHGYFVCTTCGYRLDVLPDTTDRCPECGEAINAARSE